MAVLVGPQGPRGDRGPIGPVGPRGFDGKRGPAGKNGKDGQQGIKGDRGDRGFPGTQGTQGIQGLRGKDGSPGKDGSISGVEHTLIPSDVASDSTPGSGLTAAARDHTHKGLHSIRAGVDPELFGDVVLASGTGISMAQVGNTITLSAATGTTYSFTQGLVENSGIVHNTFFTGAMGGQTLFGGTASMDDLHISSTFHAGKGTIFFGINSSDMQYDEAAQNLILPWLNAGGLLKTAIDGSVELAIPGVDFADPGAYITDLTGDVAATGPGSATATIQPNVVDYSKIQAVSGASLLLGRGDSGTGDVEEISLGSGLVMTGTVLSSTGAVSLPANEIGFGTGTGITSDTAFQYSTSLDQLQISFSKATGQNGLKITNSSNGVGAYADFALVNDLGDSYRSDIYYTSSTYTGAESFPSSLTFATAGGSASAIVFSPNNVQAMVLTETAAAFPSLSASGIVNADTNGVLGLVSIGTGLDYTAGVLSSTVSPVSDHKLSIDGSDTTYDFLAAKLTATLPLVLTVVGGPGAETLDASVLYDGATIVLNGSNELAVGTVPYASVSGTPSSLPPSGSAGGDLTGTYPNPTIGAHKVQFAQMQQIGSLRIVANPTGSTADMLDVPLGVGLDFHNYGGGLTLRNSSPLSDLAVSAPLHLSGTTIGWSGLSAGGIMFGDPVGTPTTDSAFAFNSTTKAVTAGKAVAINGATLATNLSLIAGNVTNTDRDRVQLLVGGGTLGATGTSDDSLFDVVPSNVVVRPSVSGGIYAINRFRTNALSSVGATTITEAATVYIDGKPFIGGSVSLTDASYALHVAGGTTKLDGNLHVSSPGTVTFDAGLHVTAGTTTLDSTLVLPSIGGFGTGGNAMYITNSGGTVASMGQVNWDGSILRLSTDTSQWPYIIMTPTDGVDGGTVHLAATNTVVAGSGTTLRSITMGGEPQGVTGTTNINRLDQIMVNASSLYGNSPGATATIATTFAIAGAPGYGGGANVVNYTTGYALDVMSDSTHLGGPLVQEGGTIATGGSGGDLHTSTAGNVMFLTGTTSFQTIDSSKYKDGSIITLWFTSNVTAIHNTAGTYTALSLKGGVNASCLANSCLTLLLKSGSWYEVSRSF